MTLLYLGLVLFFATHLFTSYARGPRQALVGRLGDMPYKGLYSVVALVGFVLIVKGWREAGATAAIYDAPPWAYGANAILVPVSFILFTAAYLPAGKIKGLTGHPMATGLILFSLGHLLANGDQRSVVVFGSFLAYGLLDRISYRVRGDRGAEPGPVLWDIVAIAAGLTSSVIVILWLHQYIAGVSLRPALP